MAWIKNISMYDIMNGNHPYGDDVILIQICDPDTPFPVAKHNFHSIYQFKFLDLERDDVDLNNDKITQSQANQLSAILAYALRDNKNVLVHCHMGICRSGAVCEVGVMMGFDDTGVYRNPNLLVKNLMMKNLGWTYERDIK